MIFRIFQILIAASAFLMGGAVFFIAAETIQVPGEKPPAQRLAQEVAERYGVEAWEEVEELNFTFHATVDGQEITRRWQWQPEDGTVTFYGSGSDQEEPVRYFRKAVNRPGAEDLLEIDKKFVNDSFWLLFPFHLVWDGPRAELTVEEDAPAPISGEPAVKLTITYPDTGGYTPGDAYDSWLGEDGTIHEWVYRKSNAEEPTRTVMWERHEEFGELTLALDHPGPPGSDFRVWFSDVEVKTAESADED
jgi:hypothetical protein